MSNKIEELIATQSSDEYYLPTSNNLLDIIKWMYLGNHVLLHHKGTRQILYHYPKKVSEDKPILFKINLLYMPSLLDEGEWEWYIKNEGCEEIGVINDEEMYSSIKNYNL